jgi:hypothetical protein
MNGDNESPQEVIAEEPTYELHIRLERKMQQTLKQSAKLAYKLGLTTKPELAELMNLYIACGQEILKKKYLERMGIK